MNVTVRLFAILRQRAGRDRIELELPEGARVADALVGLRCGQAGSADQVEGLALCLGSGERRLGLDCLP